MHGVRRLAAYERLYNAMCAIIITQSSMSIKLVPAQRRSIMYVKACSIANEALGLKYHALIKIK